MHVSVVMRKCGEVCVTAHHLPLNGEADAHANRLVGTPATSVGSPTVVGESVSGWAE